MECFIFIALQEFAFRFYEDGNRSCSKYIINIKKRLEEIDEEKQSFKNKISRRIRRVIKSTQTV